MAVLAPQGSGRRGRSALCWGVGQGVVRDIFFSAVDGAARLQRKRQGTSCLFASASWRGNWPGDSSTEQKTRAGEGWKGCEGGGCWRSGQVTVNKGAAWGTTGLGRRASGSPLRRLRRARAGRRLDGYSRWPQQPPSLPLAGLFPCRPPNRHRRRRG